MGYNVEGYTRTFGENRTITNLAENTQRANKVVYMQALRDKTAQLKKADFLKYVEEHSKKKNEYVVEEEKTGDTSQKAEIIEFKKEQKAEIVPLNRKNIENIKERASGGEER